MSEPACYDGVMKKPQNLPDYAAAQAHLANADPLMRRLIRQHGDCALVPETRRQPFESLVRAIAHQQLHGKAAEAILGRLIAQSSRRFPLPRDLQEMDDTALRACGFSGGKIAALRDITKHTLSGQVPTRRTILTMTDEEIVARLTPIRGVGRWTVQMLLIFQLGRPDVLPVDDFGIRHGLAVARKLPTMPTPKDVRAYGARWQPYSTVASWYLWRAADAAKAPSKKAA